MDKNKNPELKNKENSSVKKNLFLKKILGQESDKLSYRKKIKYFLLDHPILKTTLEYSRDIIISVLSAFLVAYGFRSFTAPTSIPVYEHLISGGATGAAQLLVRIASLFQQTNNADLNNTLQSVFFFVINTPLIIFSWFKIGKRFTILTLINVGCVSLFTKFLPESVCNLINFGTEIIPRPLFAGILTGCSSALAFSIGASAGGADIVALFIAEKKSTSIGKYVLIINACIVLCYVGITVVDYNIYPSKTDGIELSVAQTRVLTMALYTVIYFFTTSKVIDIFHTKNKKVELQVYSQNKDVATILIHAFPHACTIIKGQGAYSGNQVNISSMVLSVSELKNAIDIVKKVDPKAFITTIQLHQVYGQFYTKPLK